MLGDHHLQPAPMHSAVVIDARACPLQPRVAQCKAVCVHIAYNISWLDSKRTSVDQNFHRYSRFLPARAVDRPKRSTPDGVFDVQLIPLQLPHVRLRGQGLRCAIAAASAAATAAAAQVRVGRLGARPQRLGGQVRRNVEEQRVRVSAETTQGGGGSVRWERESDRFAPQLAISLAHSQFHAPVHMHPLPQTSPSAHLFAALATLPLLPTDCAPACAAAGCEAYDCLVKNESSSPMAGEFRSSLPSAGDSSWLLPFKPPSASNLSAAERRLRSQPLRGRNARNASTATAGRGGGRQGRAAGVRAVHTKTTTC